MIPGYFDPRLPGRLAPRVSTFVWLPALVPQPENLTRVEFVTDTGAIPTLSMPIDARRLYGAETPAFAAALRALSRRTSEGVGGAVAFYETVAQIGFRHEDGAFSFPELPVQVADPALEATWPSVLGFTALDKMVLYIDGPSLTVTLDAPIVRLP